MKFSLKKIGLVIIILGTLLISPHVQAAVVINEIFPKTQDITSTWIELYNSGTDPVSLDRWKIENNAGEQKSFMLNASVIIQPKSFLILSQPQYGFTLAKEGDTVRLIDASNNQADSQSYQSILGYNTSVGRSVDGGGVWADCTIATLNQSNSCPPPPTPTPVPTALPTPIPTNTPIPIPTDTPAPMIIPTTIPTTVLLPTQQVLAASTSTAAVPEGIISRNILVIGIVCIGLLWMIILAFIFIRRK